MARIQKLQPKSEAPSLVMVAFMEDGAGKPLSSRDRKRPEPPPHAIEDSIKEFIEYALPELLKEHGGQWRNLEISIRRR